MKVSTQGLSLKHIALCVGGVGVMLDALSICLKLTIQGVMMMIPDIAHTVEHTPLVYTRNRVTYCVYVTLDASE